MLFAFDLRFFAIIAVALAALILASVLVKSGFMRKSEEEILHPDDDAAP